VRVWLLASEIKHNPDDSGDVDPDDSGYVDPDETDSRVILVGGEAWWGTSSFLLILCVFVTSFEDLHRKHSQLRRHRYVVLVSTHLSGERATRLQKKGSMSRAMLDFAGGGGPKMAQVGLGLPLKRVSLVGQRRS